MAASALITGHLILLWKRLALLWPSALVPCQDDPTTFEAMDELLLPRGEEEVRSDQSSCAPGDTKRTMGERIKSFFVDSVKGELVRNVRDFCKRNGLLTLSVVAVITGCTLGFMLRGTQLSSQVQKLILHESLEMHFY